MEQAIRKKTITITMNPKLWQSFRVYCLKAGISASSEIEAFVRATLSKKNGAPAR